MAETGWSKDLQACRIRAFFRCNSVVGTQHLESIIPPRLWLDRPSKPGEYNEQKVTRINSKIYFYRAKCAENGHRVGDQDGEVSGSEFAKLATEETMGKEAGGSGRCRRVTVRVSVEQHRV